jgi:uncharacterized protein YeaC (DUF1315 family)
MSDMQDEQPPFPKPDSYAALLEQMTPQIHASLRTAVELGKWENGDRLTPAQLEHCLQAIIAWEHQNLPEEERTAFIDRGALRKTHCDD